MPGQPIAGSNPYTGAYQTRQFDEGLASGTSPVSTYSVLDSLESAPSAALAAQTADLPNSSGQLQAQLNPPVGAGGNIGTNASIAEAVGEA